MNPIHGMPLTISNFGVTHQESDENPVWSHLTLLTLAFLVGTVAYLLFRKGLPRKTESDFSQREIPTPVVQERPTMPLTPTWIKELKERGAKEVCSWVFSRDAVTVFLDKDQLFYTLTHSFQQKHSSSIWDEDHQYFSLPTDGNLPIEERISRLQKKFPIIRNREVVKFAKLEEIKDLLMKEESRLFRGYIIDEKPIRWITFYADREDSSFTILSDWSDWDEYEGRGEKEPFSLKYYTILDPHAQNCKLMLPIFGRSEGVFDDDVPYAEDYSEFASDEYYASSEGKEIVGQFLPEMCEFYKNDFDKMKAILSCFQRAIQEARSQEARCTAFEENIPYQIRLSWLAHFESFRAQMSWSEHKLTTTVRSRLDTNIQLDRDQWAATVLDTGPVASSNLFSRLGHAVLIIEGIRQSSPFMWRTDLAQSGIRPPIEVAGIKLIKGHTRTWQVSRQDSGTKKGVMSVVKQILKEKRTGAVQWGYVFGTHNCSTWAFEKLNEMLEPKDRVRVYPSIREALLYHKASTKPYPYLSSIKNINPLTVS